MTYQMPDDSGLSVKEKQEMLDYMPIFHWSLRRLPKK